MSITTQKELRTTFWEYNPKFKRGVKKVITKTGNIRFAQKKQNDYPADIRVAWCDFVENMQREGEISVMLACKATL